MRRVPAHAGWDGPAAILTGGGEAGGRLGPGLRQAGGREGGRKDGEPPPGSTCPAVLATRPRGEGKGREERSGAGRACGPREGGQPPGPRPGPRGGGERRCWGLGCCRRWQLSSPRARTAPRPPLTAPACALPAGRSAAAPEDGHQAEPHHLHQQHQRQD